MAPLMLKMEKNDKYIQGYNIQISKTFGKIQNASQIQGEKNMYIIKWNAQYIIIF